MDTGFETRVLEDGVWVSRTVGVGAALQATSAVGEPTDVLEPPPCGLLSTTVLESPQVHKILPVRLRSQEQNDIAFVGDYTITIRELLGNGQTDEVLSGLSLGQRIRNAVVIGETHHQSQESNEKSTLDAIAVPQQPAASQRPPLPPQILICALETGELVALYVMGGEAVTCKIFAPSQTIQYSGHYLAVEPHSRYIVAAGFEDVMTVHEIESWDTLKHNYEITGTVESLIETTKYAPVRATIMDVQFLFPRPQDQSHVILMALTSSRAKNGDSGNKQNYMIWDWVAGEDLSERLKSAQRHNLAIEGRTPLFTVPLKAQYSFFIICEDGVAMVPQALTGTGGYPQGIELSGEVSTVHHGKGQPLWTAWARPFREEWFEKTDIVYLAREDGKIQSFEIDVDTLIPSVTEFDDDNNDGLGINIGTAFATTHDKSADIIIVGGNSGNGGVWRIGPRSSPQKMSVIDDWTPVIDMTSTSNDLSWEAAAGATENNQRFSRGATKRDRIFFASGRGKKGCIVEPRHGLKARIGLEMDLGDTAKDVWLFPDLQSLDESMDVILALPHSTQVIHMSANFQDIVAESPDSTPFDLSSRTIHASCTSPGYVVQITEKTITLITPSQRSQHSFEDIFGSSSISAEQACRRDETIVVYTSSAVGPRLHVLCIEEMAVLAVGTHAVSEDITCLSIIDIGGSRALALGTVDSEGPLLCIHSLVNFQGFGQGLRQNLRTRSGGSEPFEALTGISILKESEDAAYLFAGTRCGHVITITFKSAPLSVVWVTERLGLGPVGIFPNHVQTQENAIAFATCDNTVLRLSRLSDTDQANLQRKEVILPVNIEEPSMVTPSIHAVFATQRVAESSPLLLLLGGTQLYFAELDGKQGPVTRILPLGQSPTRLIYSNLWHRLVVALALPNGSGVELSFIDPDHSLDPSSPYWSSESKPLDGKEHEGRLASFDTSGDRVLVLREWLYIKGGRTFSFLIVGLKSAKLIVVSVNHNKQAEQDPLRRSLTHSSRYKLKALDGPVTAVVTDEKGFLCCAGKTLQRYVLEDRKLVSVKRFELDSPAISLEIHAGTVYALTTGHSLEVVDYQSNPDSKEMTLLHCDSVTRSGMDMIQIGPAADRSRWPISLVADSRFGVTGIWTPRGHENRELPAVFDGVLSNPVRKFVRSRCRTNHLGSLDESQFEGLPSTADNAEVLGISLNGKLRRFRLLGPQLWAVLDAVQHLTLEFWPDVPLWRQCKRDSMHINGDVLVYCFQGKVLQHMVRDEPESPLLIALERLDGGRHIGKIRSECGAWDLPRVCELCYTIIEHLLIPFV